MLQNLPCVCQHLTLPTLGKSFAFSYHTRTLSTARPSPLPLISKRDGDLDGSSRVWPVTAKLTGLAIRAKLYFSSPLFATGLCSVPPFNMYGLSTSVPALCPRERCCEKAILMGPWGWGEVCHCSYMLLVCKMPRDGPLLWIFLVSCQLTQMKQINSQPLTTPSPHGHVRCTLRSIHHPS